MTGRGCGEMCPAPGTPHAAPRRPADHPDCARPRPSQARKACRAAEAVVGDFKAGAAQVDALCRSVAECMLVDVERKRLYDLPDFEAVQAEHHAKVGGVCSVLAGRVCGRLASAAVAARAQTRVHPCSPPVRLGLRPCWRASVQ